MGAADNISEFAWPLQQYTLVRINLSAARARTCRLSSLNACSAEAVDDVARVCCNVRLENSDAKHTCAWGQGYKVLPALHHDVHSDAVVA